MAQFQARVFRDYMLDDEQSWSVPVQNPPPQSRISQYSPPPQRNSQQSPLPSRNSQQSPSYSQRSPPQSRVSDRADTPQTVVLDYDGPNEPETESENEPEKESSYGPAEERRSSRIEYGIARTTPDDIVREKVPLHPGYASNIGLARTVEESYIDDSSSATSDAEPVEPTLHSAQIEPLQTNGVVDGVATAMPPEIPRKHSYNKQPMSPISERSTLKPLPSPPVRSSETGADTVVRTMPEFFSMSVFQTALYNPTISHQLLKFGRSRLCGENMEFLARVHRFSTMVNSLSREIVELHDEFVHPNAVSQINVAQAVRDRTTQETRVAMSTTVPALEDLFHYAQMDIENLVYGDVYPKFVRHQMTLSAAKALAGDRKQYGGLGDCFVLTDPNKADNPIVFASDGFVSVTGYTRNEIIPRNCRFLQGKHTHQMSVKRLRKKIDKQEESVELLLNYKKNGEPFWNLLYTTPLFDSNGKLVYFLGGQINCSTTIHTSSDVLRILAQSKEDGEDETSRVQTPQAQAAKQPRSRRMLSVFRTNSNSNIRQQTPGMENKLLNKLEEMPLKGQMDTFYTAYSNYIIINYSTFLITFVSTGLLDLLFPIKAAKASASAPSNAQITPSTTAVGTDVFKFLSNHGTGSSSRFSSSEVSWDFKSTIKSGLKLGNPVSVEMSLCARPLMGFERFVLHWTPLKDEKGAVQWVVLTLGNERRA